MGKVRRWNLLQPVLPSGQPLAELQQDLPRHHPNGEHRQDKFKKASDQRLTAANGSSEPFVAAPVFENQNAQAEAIEVDSDMDSCAATESAYSTESGMSADPPSADEEFGDGNMHPCMYCKAMTRIEWRPVLCSFCKKECYDKWMERITASQAADKWQYESRAQEITINTFPDPDEDEVRQCGCC